MKRVRIFWTGGFDSTFRVSQLSKFDIEIEPHYMCDKRSTKEYELKAISEIREYLESLEDTKAKFLPLVYHPIDDLEENKEVTEAFSRVFQKHYMGRQYEYLGIVSKMFPGIETGVHVHDKFTYILEDENCLKKVHDDIIGDYYVVDESIASKELATLSKDFHFPLVKYTKKQMRKEFIDNNLDEVMDMTWFCFTPIDGKPCGKCNACKGTIKEGLYSRFEKKALIRYALRRLGYYSFKWLKRKMRTRLKYDKIRYSRYLKNDLNKYKRLSKKDYKKFLKVLKKDMKKYLSLFKEDIKKYGGYFKYLFFYYV